MSFESDYDRTNPITRERAIKDWIADLKIKEIDPDGFMVREAKKLLALNKK